MREFFSVRLRALVWGGLVWAFLVGSALGQEPTQKTTQQRITIPADHTLADSLQQGAVLERQGRWGEALTHYEQAVREFPDRQELRERLSLVRIRFDLVRRYADSSYLDTIRQLSLPAALDLFGEVATKIEAHHVESANWTAWMLRGTDGLEAAMEDEAFLKQHAVAASIEERAWVVAEIRRILQQRRVVDREDARVLVNWVAEVSHDRLAVPAQATVLEYVCALVSSLDNYSTFLTPSQLDEVYSQIEGNFVGLGVELKTDDNTLLITSVISGGPAEQAGIRAGDRIVGVDGRSVGEVSVERAADMLKGEQGTLVRIEIASPQQTVRSLSIRRERVEVPSVEQIRILDTEQGIGYLRITSFQKSTSRDIDNALWRLYRQGMKSLVVDVRGNPGGLLNESVDVADKFVSEGTIVRTRGRIAEEDFDFRAHRVGTWGVPLVVLIDGDSASASEIFAGAIRDHHRGTIVGQRTYGKGSVQGIFPLRTIQGGLRLTTAKFFSPSGQAISYLGVTPDVMVQQVARPDQRGQYPGDGTDQALAAGLDVARQRLAQR